MTKYFHRYDLYTYVFAAHLITFVSNFGSCFLIWSAENRKELQQNRRRRYLFMEYVWRLIL